jgi:hypothetical protein
MRAVDREDELRAPSGVRRTQPCEAGDYAFGVVVLPDVTTTGTIDGVTGGEAGGATGGVAGEEAVAGVLVLPVMAAFCLLPSVWRAARVALALASMITLSAGEITGFLCGVSPKSARVPMSENIV